MFRIIFAVFLFMVVLLGGEARADIYSWMDDQGTQHYTTRYESIPEPYRPRAQTLSLPQSPPPPQNLKPGPPARGTTRISFMSGSPVLAAARINGAGPVTLILDTGADRTLVKASVLSGLGISIENSNRVAIKGVTGTDYATAVWVNSVEVGEAKVGPLLIIAHDTDLKGADGLLGRDFLASFNVTIDPKEQIVTLTPN
jgi:predicted aspartyl protease